ncbi:arylsulfatase [Desertivirga xinjiangensis]|uniref:arylsulfatase n=1 Tax=Desertivirga xinjiangensis TaxID=539206 RepID=UPI0021086FC9|nr:arylsulfatase [Pedobacter xinjiangensis]
MMIKTSCRKLTSHRKHSGRSSAASFLLLLSCINPGSSQTGTKKSDSRPNIIVIMADDMGYSDLGCYGGEINTPNLDYLAKEGIRFSQFYNTSRCCPTRASLLTGLYNQQAGIGSMTRDQKLPAYRGYLTENTVTLAEVLKQAGYHTGMVGKWHVSNTIEQDGPQEQLKWLNHQSEHPAFSPLSQYPTNRGFERFYGTLWGVIDFYDPFSLVNGTKPVKRLPVNYYHTDAINDTAASYVKQFSASKAPFFLYVAHNAPHWPVQALPEDIEKYKNTYKVGWDAIRKSRYEKMLKLGLINADTHPLSAASYDIDWNNNPHKEWDARVMAVHAAMIDRMDQGIGRIIQVLKETGRLENTLIVFLSDNGASPEEAHTLIPGFDRPGETRDGKPIVYPKNKEVLPGPQTVFAGIGKEWANVSNTPFRYWKRESYEGGVRTPMIAYWPKGIKDKSGNKVSSHLGHVMDFMATFVELAQTKYPTTYQGRKITPTSGVSLLSAITSSQQKQDRTLFNEHAYSRSVRSSDWKLVKLKPEDPWELYKAGSTETVNLAAKYPEKVKELEVLWNEWAVKNKVLPKPGK